MPNLTWVVANTSLTLSPRDYIYHHQDGVCECLLGGENFPSTPPTFASLAVGLGAQPKKDLRKKMMERRHRANVKNGEFSPSGKKGDFPADYSFQCALDAASDNYLRLEQEPPWLYPTRLTKNNITGGYKGAMWKETTRFQNATTETKVDRLNTQNRVWFL